MCTSAVWLPACASCRLTTRRLSHLQATYIIAVSVSLFWLRASPWLIISASKS